MSKRKPAYPWVMRDALVTVHTGGRRFKAKGSQVFTEDNGSTYVIVRPTFDDGTVDETRVPAVAVTTLTVRKAPPPKRPAPQPVTPLSPFAFRPALQWNPYCKVGTPGCLCAIRSGLSVSTL